MYTLPSRATATSLRKVAAPVSGTANDPTRRAGLHVVHEEAAGGAAGDEQVPSETLSPMAEVRPSWPPRRNGVAVRAGERPAVDRAVGGAADVERVLVGGDALGEHQVGRRPAGIDQVGLVRWCGAGRALAASAGAPRPTARTTAAAAAMRAEGAVRMRRPPGTRRCVPFYACSGHLRSAAVSGKCFRTPCARHSEGEQSRSHQQHPVTDGRAARRAGPGRRAATPPPAGRRSHRRRPAADRRPGRRQGRRARRGRRRQPGRHDRGDRLRPGVRQRW